MEGIYKRYYLTGQLWMEVNYTDNKMEIIYRKYFRNGKLFENGKLLEIKKLLKVNYTKNKKNTLINKFFFIFF